MLQRELELEKGLDYFGGDPQLDFVGAGLLNRKVSQKSRDPDSSKSCSET